MLLKLAPALTLALFLLPVAAGLVGTWLPAFGLLPALGGTGLSLQPWRDLFAAPGLPEALRISVTSGFAAALLSLWLVVGLCATCHDSPWFRRVQRAIPPLLATPHVALAIGLAFLIAPSGWLVRLLSPWATGWTLPPQIATVQDSAGLSLVAGLVIKETVFLLLMTLAALNQIRAGETLAVARSLGYSGPTAWLKTVFPALYPQIRLPVYAVLAFSLSVVDVALVLAPNNPPPLSVLVLRWFQDRDLALTFQAAAGATLMFALVLGAIALWRLGEIGVARLARGWLTAGGRGAGGRAGAATMGAAFSVLILAALGCLATLLLWSFAGAWRFPSALPGQFTFDNWVAAASGLRRPIAVTLSVALASAIVAVGLALACLENEQRHGITPTGRALWLLYAPLLAPQIGFLFGLQVLLVSIGLDATWWALTWSHLLFVLPYVFLSLADPYRALDSRFARTALCLGASPARTFWRVKLPMLLRPILFAAAIGFAVSVGLYLPTQFAGAGRFPTLTTEAVTLASGADRRVIGVYAVLQAVLPLLAFAGALALPRRLYRNRRGLR